MVNFAMACVCRWPVAYHLEDIRTKSYSGPFCLLYLQFAATIMYE